MLLPRNKLPVRKAAPPPPSDAAARQQPFQPPSLQQPEPAEAAVVKDMLKSLGHTRVDPRVVHLLMDLTYQTTSDILRDAEAINIAAGGSGAELTPQDIALAATQHARQHPQPPTLAELHALARRVNAQPLTGPSDKQHGIKLPPVADCLLSQNYQLRERPRVAPPAAAAVQQLPGRGWGVRQAHKLAVKVPQDWQPRADVAGVDAQPFAAPALGQQAAGGQQQGMAAEEQQAQQQQEQQQGQAMDVDQEEI